MKAIIDGKRYNTESAERLFGCGSPANVSRSDFGWWEGTVYRTKGWAYFIAGEGNASSRFAERVGERSYGAGSGIQPLTEREALELAEQHTDADTTEQEFGTLITEPRGPGRPGIGPMVNVRMPQDLIDRLDAEAERHSATRAEIIRSMLWQQLYEARTGRPYTERVPGGGGSGTDEEEGI